MVAGAVLLVLGSIALLARHRARHGDKSARADRRAAAAEAFEAENYELARAGARTLVEEDARDARAWQILAMASKALGEPRAKYLSQSERALELKPRLITALEFLTREHFRVGEYDDAARYALRAAETSPATAGAWALVADCEMSRIAPDMGRAVYALGQARRLGGPDLEIRARIAELRVRMLGATPPETMPSEIQLELLDVDVALAADRESVNPRIAPTTSAWLRATILVAAGQPALALREIERCEDALAADAPAEERAHVALLRARARGLERNYEAESRELSRALALAPSGAVPSEVAVHLGAGGRGEEAVDLLSEAAASTPTAAVVRALARLHLGVARTSEAQAALDLHDLDDPSLLLVRADVLRAEGDVVAARNAYALAASGAVDPLPARVGEALTALVESGPSRETALIEAEAALAGMGDVAMPRVEVMFALGRVRLARGDLAGASTALNQAAAVDPWNAILQLVRAETWARTTERGAHEAATDAALMVLDMRPYDARVAAPAMRVLLTTGRVHDALFRQRRSSIARPTRRRCCVSVRSQRCASAGRRSPRAIWGGRSHSATTTPSRTRPSSRHSTARSGPETRRAPSLPQSRDTGGRGPRRHASHTPCIRPTALRPACRKIRVRRWTPPSWPRVAATTRRACFCARCTSGTRVTQMPRESSFSRCWSERRTRKSSQKHGG